MKGRGSVAPGAREVLRFPSWGINVTGAILADGADGQQGTHSIRVVNAGGGGSGGGILLSGNVFLDATALLSAMGGAGGNGNTTGGITSAGGGGGGGRIKVFGPSTILAGFSFDVSGGAAGTGNATETGFVLPTDGLDGTYHVGSSTLAVPEPSTGMLFGTGMLGLHVWHTRRGRRASTA